MLKSVSVNALKMDMQFLKIDVQKEKWGVGILESLIRMARQMDIPIIVEGIETKAQEAFLNNLGCHYVQGYKYYRPMPVDEFEKMIEDETCVDFGKLINSASE